MKTRIYTSTFLVFIIQGTIISQTISNHQESNRSRNLPTIGGPNSNYSFQSNENSEGNIYYVSSNRSELLKQAEELMSDYKILQAEADNNIGPEKEKYRKQAEILKAQAEANQIKASEIIGKTNKEIYKRNNECLIAIIEICKEDDYAVNQAIDLISSACLNIRLGQEMREEAYAMPTNASKVGALFNAEEQESLAINAQTKAIELLKSTHPQIANNIKAILGGNSLAVR